MPKRFGVALRALGAFLGVIFAIFTIFVLRDAMFYAALIEGLKLPEEFAFINPVLGLAPEITLISSFLIIASILLKAKEEGSERAMT